MIAAIVQARLGSKRFPRKTLALIQGKPMLWHVLDRLKRAAKLDRVLVATSSSPTDDALEKWLKRMGVPFFRGSENDVLDRYYGAAKSVDAGTIVRITADCPLIMPDVVDRVIGEFLSSKVDYASNTQPPTFPDGLDTEVFTFSALETAWREAREPDDREHVTPYFYRSGRFKTLNVAAEKGEDWSQTKWSVDYPEDLRLIRRIYRIAGENVFDWRALCKHA